MFREEIFYAIVKLFLQLLSMLRFRLASKLYAQLTELQNIHLRQQHRSMNLAAL